MSASTGSGVNPIIPGPVHGYLFVDGYGVFHDSTKVFHHDRGYEVYDYRGQFVWPGVVPSTPRQWPPPTLYTDPRFRPDMIYVAGHGIFPPETAGLHLILGRHVFDRTGAPLRGPPGFTNTSVAGNNRDGSKMPGRGTGKWPERVHPASPAVQGQLAEIDRRLAEARKEDAKNRQGRFQKDGRGGGSGSGAAGGARAS